MPTIDQLLQLGYLREQIEWTLSEENQVAILNYHAKLTTALGFSKFEILTIASKFRYECSLNSSVPQMFEALFVHGERLRRKWGITNSQLVKIALASHATEFMQELEQFEVQLKQRNCSFAHLHKLNTNNRLLIDLLCNHQQSLNQFGISIAELASITRPYANHMTTEWFLNALGAVANEIGLSFANWAILSDRSKHISGDFIKLILESKNEYLQFAFLTPAQLMNFGMQDIASSGLSIQLICKHHIKLLELGLDKATLISMISNIGTVEVIQALADQHSIIIKKHLNLPKEILLQMSELKTSPGRSIKQLVKKCGQLRKLGITPDQFPLISQNYNLDREIDALITYQDQLAALGLTSAAQLASIARCPVASKTLKAIFDNLNKLSAFGITSGQEILSLATQSLGYETVEFLAQYHSLAANTGMTVDKLKQAILENQFEIKALGAVLEHSQVLKNDLQLQENQLLKMIKTTSNADIAIKLIVDNVQDFKKVPRHEIVGVLAQHLTSVKRIASLNSLIQKYHHAPPIIQSVNSVPTMPVVSRRTYAPTVKVNAEPVPQVEDEVELAARRLISIRLSSNTQNASTSLFRPKRVREGRENDNSEDLLETSDDDAMQKRFKGNL